MMNPKKYLLLTLGFVLATTLFGVGDTFAQDEEAEVDTSKLDQLIEEKRQEVESLNKEIQQTQSTIVQLQGQGRTLQTAVVKLDSTIKQTSLTIRSSEVNIDKLGLEILSLGQEMQEVGSEVIAKQAAVGEVLRRLQRSDERSLIEALLGGGTLADSVSEINAFKSIQDDLTVNVAELAALHDQLNGTIAVNGDKKSQLEVEKINLENRKSILGSQKGQKEDLLVKTKSQENEYQNLLTDLEKQQQALLDDISNIEDQLKKGFDRSTVPSREPGFLMWPLTSGGVSTGILTQHYGEMAYASRFYGGKPHNGTDIGAPSGTEVRAAASGTIAHVDFNGNYYLYGRYILINHGNGLTTMYAHLSQTVVSAGRQVQQGDLIGYVGSTGQSTGPHLHFGLYATPAVGWGIGSRETGGLISVPPASGLIPVGVTLNPEQYL